MHCRSPYENMIYFKPILYLFYILFYSYLLGIFSLFSWTILKQFFIYFKPIILKQKIVKNSRDLWKKAFVN